MVKIVLLTDGKPGHETQSIGITKLLNKAQNFEIIKIRINKPKKIVQQIFKRFYHMLSKEWMLSFFLTPEALKSLNETSDIFYIISAGGDTLLPNALLKLELMHQSRAVKNIIATSLRGMPPSAYDLVFTIDEAKQNCSPYVYYPVAPNKLISFNLEGEKNLAKKKLQLSLAQECISILIGADTSEVKIGRVLDWVQMIKKLSKKYSDKVFFVTTSRRTSHDFEYALKNNLNLMNVILLIYNEEEKISIQDLIYASDTIICSPDSTSMVSEVLVAEKNLIIASFNSTQLNESFEGYYFNLSSFLNIVNFDNEDVNIIANKDVNVKHSEEMRKKIKKALN